MTESEYNERITENTRLCQKNISDTSLKWYKIKFFVLIATVYAMVSGSNKGDGIYFYQFEHGLNETTTKISLAFGIMQGVIYIGGPLYGHYLDYVGPRTALMSAGGMLAIGYMGTSHSYTFGVLVFFHSLFRGAAFGLATLSTFTLVGRVFNNQRSFANNILGAASSAFIVLLAPVIQKGIDFYSWRGTLLLEGGIMLNTFPIYWMASKYFKLIENDSAVSINGQTEVSGTFKLCELISDPMLIMFCLANCGTTTFRVMHHSYLVRYAQSIGISDLEASSLVSVYQGFYGTMCLIVGYITGKIKSKANKNNTPPLIRTSTIMIVIAVLQISTAYIPIGFPCYIGYLIYTITAGILGGSTGNLPMTLTAEYFGTERLAIALGLRNMAVGCYVFFLLPVVGKLVDINGTYSSIQYLAAVLEFIGAILLFFTEIGISKRKTLQ